MIHNLDMDKEYCRVVRGDTSAFDCPWVNIFTNHCMRYKKKFSDREWASPAFSRLEECLIDEKRESENGKLLEVVRQSKRVFDLSNVPHDSDESMIEWLEASNKLDEMTEQALKKYDRKN